MRKNLRLAGQEFWRFIAAETPTDSLLWGYYGDGGYGFLIRFDPQHEWFWAQENEHDDFRHLRQVLYVSARAPKYVLEIKGGDALYSKGIEWEHEREWWIIRNFNDTAQKVGPIRERYSALCDSS